MLLVEDDEGDALENTRLERGLLPTPLVKDPRIRIATHYVAGSRRSLLGGDFFDVVEDHAGCLRAIIGDVAGHGPDEAAVGVCLRIAWRTLVLSGIDNDAVLGLLQEVLVAERHARSVFATVATIAIEPDRDSVTLRSAGHLSPLLFEAAGPPRPLIEGPGGPPLGVVEGATWRAAEVALDTGWSLLLHTDGLVEGLRGDGVRLGQDGLATVAVESNLDGSDPVAAVRAMVERVTELNGGPLRDDVAVVYLGA